MKVSGIKFRLAFTGGVGVLFHGPGEDKQCSVLIGLKRSVSLLVGQFDCEGVLHMRFLSDGCKQNKICQARIVSWNFKFEDCELTQ